MKQILTFLLFTVLFILLTSCTTIELAEDDAFDAHRTVTPATFNIEPYRFNELSIDTEDGETLNAWFLEKENAKGTVIYYGGNGFLMVKARPLIEAYSAVPVNLLLIDYRGYGLSSGEPSVNGIKTDAETAYDSVLGEYINGDELLIVHGHSMGSFLSAFIADEKTVDAYILESPVTEVKGWTKTMVPWFLRLFVRFDIADELKDQNNSERVGRIEIPLLIIGGTADDVTPFKMAEELYGQSSSQQKELVKIEGGSHNDLPKYRLYRNAIQEFIEDL